MLASQKENISFVICLCWLYIWSIIQAIASVLQWEEPAGIFKHESPYYAMPKLNDDEWVPP